jgi:hypothetical protein
VSAKAPSTGRYLATSALDKQLVVWEISGSEATVVAKHPMPALVSSVCWHSSANELLLALANNVVMTWRGVTPSHMVEPHALIPISTLVGAPIHLLALILTKQSLRHQ